METIPFSVRSAVFGVLKTLAVKANQSKLDLMYSVEGDIPDLLVGDPFRLRQVITNLIGNAISKHFETFVFPLAVPAHARLPARIHNSRASCPLVPASIRQPGRQDLPTRVLHFRHWDRDQARQTESHLRYVRSG